MKNLMKLPFFMIFLVGSVHAAGLPSEWPTGTNCTRVQVYCLDASPHARPDSIESLKYWCPTGGACVGGQLPACTMAMSRETCHLQGIIDHQSYERHDFERQLRCDARTPTDIRSSRGGAKDAIRSYIVGCC